GDVGKGPLLEDVAVLRERSIRRHDRPPLSWPQAENAVSEHLSTFIGDVSIRPCSRSLSAFRPWMCISASGPVPPPFGALPRVSGELVGARLGQAPQSEQQTDDALLDQQRVLCVRIAQPLARPIALLLRETERRRQHLQLQKEIVRRQTSGPKTRHHRGTHALTTASPSSSTPKKAPMTGSV